MKINKLMFPPVLVTLLLMFTSCDPYNNSKCEKEISFSQYGNNSSGSYWEYELSSDDILTETDYHTSKSPLNPGPGYTQHWTFKIEGEGEVVIKWIAYKGDKRDESKSFSNTYIFNADGSYEMK